MFSVVIGSNSSAAVQQCSVASLNRFVPLLASAAAALNYKVLWPEHHGA